MRSPLLGAYARMLPRLQAEEELRLIAAVAAGTGAMKKNDQKSYLRRLASLAGTPKKRPTTLAELQQMGFRVEHEHKKESGG